MGSKRFSFRASDASVIQIEAHDVLPSTADLAKEYADAGYPDRFVVFADRQTTAPITGTKLKEGASEEGIFMSCILRPSLFASQTAFLRIMTAVALQSALAEHSPRRFGIGWVSDIYCEGKRIGGATLEGKLDAYTAFEYMIVTFAVRTDKENFPPRLTDMIRKVFETDGASLQMIIGYTILSRFFALYPSLKTPQKFMKEYSKNFVLRGKKIKLRQSDGRYKRTKVLGVDPKKGALCVEAKRGEVALVTASGVILPKRIKMPT